MGTIFANPVLAMPNVCQALVPGGRLCMIVWRRKIDNDWVHRAETVVERYLEEDEGSGCRPRPGSSVPALRAFRRRFTCNLQGHGIA
jgi:hypothetical protein